MNRQAKLLVLVTVGLIAATAVAITRLRAAQRLGQPGVKVVAHRLFDETGALAATNAVFFPERILNFEGKDVAITRVELDWLPKDTTYGRRLYLAPDGFQAQLMAVLMGTDRTSIHKPQQCLTGQGLQIQSQEPVRIAIKEPHPYDLPALKLTATGQAILPSGEKSIVHAIYVYWFVAEDELTADHNQRMKSMARNLLTSGVLQRWAYVSCLAFCVPGQEDAAYARMVELIASGVPQFQLATGASSGLARNP
jgi:hypothetical protein